MSKSVVRESEEGHYPDTIEGYRAVDPQEAASKLVDIEDRLESSEYRFEDFIELNRLSEELEDYRGLENYSQDLLERYRMEVAGVDLKKFEEYRNPVEYGLDIAGDLWQAARNSSYGETGVEFFNESSDELGDLKDDAELRAFELMSTNIGREVVLNFMRYKPRGPFWDIFGGTYGFFKGARMELEERDIQERFSEVTDNYDLDELLERD